MLPLDKYVLLIKEWAKNKQFSIMRQSATKRLEAKGYIDLGIGSWYRFIHKEWFDNAVKEGIIKKSENGQWLPPVDFIEEKEIIGMRGKNPVYSKKKNTSKMSQDSLDKLTEFDKRYKSWLYSQQQISMELDNLVKQYEKQI